MTTSTIQLTYFAYNSTSVSLKVWKEYLLTLGYTREEIKVFGKLNVKKTYVDYTRNLLDITVEHELTTNYRKTTKTDFVVKDNVVDVDDNLITDLTISTAEVSQDILDRIYQLADEDNVAASYLVDRYNYSQEVDDIERITPYNDEEDRYYSDNELGITQLLNELYGGTTPPAIFQFITTPDYDELNRLEHEEEDNYLLPVSPIDTFVAF
jgi:hypothetical protein